MPVKVTEDGRALVSIQGDSGTSDIVSVLEDILAELQTANQHLAAIETNTEPAA